MKVEHITMDFVVGLSCTQIRHNAIWVIVDQLTKLAHFLAIHSIFFLKRLVRLNINEIVKLHGIPVSIVSGQNPRFTSQFWPKLQKALDTTLHFNTTFNLQTDGQFERTDVVRLQVHNIVSSNKVISQVSFP